jgi:hypothetical protein
VLETFTIYGGNMKLSAILSTTVVALAAYTLPASAALLSAFGDGEIIAAPASVSNFLDGAKNDHMQGFDEQQNVLLAADLAVDGGVIAAGTRVASHMIFLDQTAAGPMNLLTSIGGFKFKGNILGVMTLTNGTQLAASSAFLGAAGTFYPAAFNHQGLDEVLVPDSYSVAGNVINLTMNVTQPGDWIRVITEVPVPAAGLLLPVALAGLAGLRRRRKAV